MTQYASRVDDWPMHAPTWAPLYPSSAPQDQNLVLPPMPAPAPVTMTAPVYTAPLHTTQGAKEDIHSWIKESKTSNILIIVALVLCFLLALWIAKLSYRISVLDGTMTMFSGGRRY